MYHDHNPVGLGCDCWSLPRDVWPEFPAAGSHLERYAARLNAAEINYSFYRPHQHEPYARSAASVPVGLRFSVKLAKTIIHQQRLKDPYALLDKFLAQVTGVGAQLGCLGLHGSPRMYYSANKRAALDALAATLQLESGSF